MRPHRLPRGAGRRLRLAHAVHALAPARRRLRHHRLLRRRSPARHARRPARRRAHGGGGRHPDDRRPRREPHVQRSTRGSRTRAAGRTRPSTTSTCGATRSPRRSRATWSSPTRRTRTGRSTRRRSSGTCTASTRTSPTSTWGTPRCAMRSPRRSGFWLEQGLSGFRVDAVPFLIEPSGADAGDAGQDPHKLMRDLRRFIGRRQRRRGAAGRGQPGAGQAAGVLRRRGRRRASGRPLVHREPGDVPRARARGGDVRSRGRSRRSRRSPRTASGRTSCATTTSSRSTS